MDNTNTRIRELERKLNDRELKAIELLIANSYAPRSQRRTLAAIAEEVGVAEKALYNMRQKPAFIELKELRSHRILEGYRDEVDGQLMSAIRGGSNGVPSLRAIELYYKLRGITGAKESADDDSKRITINIDEIRERIKSKRETTDK